MQPELLLTEDKDSPWQSLPNEIIAHICSFLGPAEIGKMAIVCKKLRDIIFQFSHNDLELYKLFLKVYFNEKQSSIFEYYLQQLEVERRDFPTRRERKLMSSPYLKIQFHHLIILIIAIAGLILLLPLGTQSLKDFGVFRNQLLWQMQNLLESCSSDIVADRLLSQVKQGPFDYINGRYFQEICSRLNSYNCDMQLCHSVLTSLLKNNNHLYSGLELILIPILSVIIFIFPVMLDMKREIHKEYFKEEFNTSKFTQFFSAIKTRSDNVVSTNEIDLLTATTVEVNANIYKNNVVLKSEIENLKYKIQSRETALIAKRQEALFKDSAVPQLRNRSSICSVSLQHLTKSF